MHYHNTNHKELSRDAKVQALMAQVEDFKGIMGRNINVLMENTQKINSLQQMSEDMQHDAQIFKKRSSALRHNEQRRMYLTLAFGAGILIILIYFAVFSICGPQLEACKSTSSDGGGGSGGGG